MIFKGYLFSLLYGGFCILLALIAGKLGLAKPYTRKIVHILVGFEWVILTHYFGASIHFLVVCLIFTALLLVSYLFNLTPSMSSDDDNAPGTVYYGVAMSIMAAITLWRPEFLYPFGVAVFCTSFGDGFAGVVGQSIRKHNPKIYGKKSLFGALANFVFSFLSAYLVTKLCGVDLPIPACLAVAVLSTGIELIVGKGLDNIALPLATSLLTFAFLSSEQTVHYIIPILVTPFIIALVLEKELLTPRGVVFAALFDLAVSVALGNFGFVLLLFFLVGSALIDKFKEHFKRREEVAHEKSRRGEIQVIANGLFPVMLALAARFFLEYSVFFILLYTTALAEAFADTAASGFGAASPRAFDPFRRKPCPNGLSGGMSLIGTAASLVAAFLAALIASAFGVLSLPASLVAGGAAFFGAAFDSFLGSVAQVKFRCPVCGVLTEKRKHCGAPIDPIAARESGCRFINNDAVNFLSGVFAAALSAVAFFVLL